MRHRNKPDIQLKINNKSRYEFTDYHEMLFNNYVRYHLIGRSYFNPVLYMIVAMGLIGVTLNIVLTKGNISHFKVFIYSGIIVLAVLQIFVSIKQLIKTFVYEHNLFNPKHSKLTVYDGVIRGYPLEGRFNRVLVNIRKSLEAEAMPESSEDSQDIEKVNIDKDTENKKHKQTKYIDIPEMAFIDKSFIVYVDDDMLSNNLNNKAYKSSLGIEAIIIELDTDGKKNYFTYPAECFGFTTEPRNQNV